LRGPAVISDTPVDVPAVKEFQESVIEAIRDESPETARRIVAAHRSGAPCGSIELSTVTRGFHGDVA